MLDLETVQFRFKLGDFKLRSLIKLWWLSNILTTYFEVIRLVGTIERLLLVESSVDCLVKRLGNIKYKV